MYTYMCVYISHFLYAFMHEGHLSSFHASPAVHNASVNMGMQTSLQDPIFISSG